MGIPLTYQVLTNLNCNLDCSYCYERKNSRRNTPEDIRLFLEILFKRDKEKDNEVVVDVIGGEPLLYPDLIEEVCGNAVRLSKEYDKKMYINISTNGTQFNREEVREVLLKYKDWINMGISIDGPKDVHDRNRILKDGSGSYDLIMENLPWLFKHFCKKKLGVKATFTNATMPRYAECVKHIFSLGFVEVGANLVYEEVSDSKVILPQLLEVADFLADNPGLVVQQLPATLIADDSAERNHNYCGSCEFMTCLGFDRKVYGCNRFCTMGDRGTPIGILSENGIEAINNGFVQEVINQWREYPDECMKCHYKMTCPSCAAAPYEEGDVKEYLNEKRMCGWTHAVVLARNYLANKIKQKGGGIDTSTCCSGNHPD